MQWNTAWQKKERKERGKVELLIFTTNLDESQRHYVEWKKPIEKDYIPTLAIKNWSMVVRDERWRKVWLKGQHLGVLFWYRWWWPQEPMHVLKFTKLYTKNSILGYDNIKKFTYTPYLCLRKPLNFGQYGAAQGDWLDGYHPDMPVQGQCRGLPER